MSTTSSFWPGGAVYGVLLNFQAERDALGAAMEQPPYKAPPQAPVLYLKPHNTWSPSGAPVPLPPGATQAEVGATLGMVIGAPTIDGDRMAPTVAGYVLLNDLSLPHASFHRPPVRFKCPDGFLGIGSPCASPEEIGDPTRIGLEVRINGTLRQSLRFDALVRDPARLLAEVHAFVGLRAGDILMLGCAPDRPCAQAGDHIEIHAPALPALGTLRQPMQAAPQQEVVA